MFVGHFGLGFGAKKAVPDVSLGALFMACQFADLSHSLLALVVWAALFGVLYRVSTHSRTLAAVTLGLLVLSHWFLDVIMHRPDMPLTLAGSTRVGLGLWNSMAGTLAIELLIFAAGIIVTCRRPRHEIAWVRSGCGRSSCFCW